MKGYITQKYCPKCDECTDCYRNVEREDLDIVFGGIRTVFTLGLNIIADLEEPKYWYTCQECNHTFYQNDL
jgi:hypothetical protein